jgi:translation initiation factor eIF-2B subunit delta
VAPDISERLERLRNDRVSGAAALALQALDLALAAPEDHAELARQLQRMHPAIATVANVGRLLEGGASTEELRVLRRSLAEGNQRIAAHAVRILPAGACVLTLSDSSTVEAVFRALAPRRVVVLESQPGGEGRRFAARWNAEVIPDAAMGRRVSEIDYVIAGVDAFDAAGAVVHKIGTLPLALCCAYFHKPFYAAGHSFKLSPVETADLLKSAGAAGAHFDRTPSELITAILTERGVEGRNSPVDFWWKRLAMPPASGPAR